MAKTRPIEELLPLPLGQPQQEVMNLFHDAIHELVCRGTHILHWLLLGNKNKGSNELCVAVPLLFRHILELFDSVSVQVKQGVVTPSQIQLRAALEAYLSLEYIIEIPEKQEFRAACYLITDHYREYNLNKKYIPGTPENIKYKKALETYSEVLTALPEDEVFVSYAKKKDKNLEELIGLPHYDEARKAYLEYTKDNTKKLDNLKWHALEGIISTYELAEKLKKIDFYNHFYKPFSNPTHGTNLSVGVITKMEDGMGAFNQLRILTGAEHIIEVAIGLCLQIYLDVTRKLLPKEYTNFFRWYVLYKSTYLDKIKRLKIDHTPSPSEL